jgi:N-succinyl-L-ornithine transcarbamylase
MSTQKAAYNLGMNVISVSMDKEGWSIEFEDGAVMNSNKTEHIKEAAGVIGQYCDIIGIRCFPGLTDRKFDYDETVLNQFIRYCGKPVISLESATLHPLQSFADLITITEHWKKKTKPKVVLTWAPHVKALPQAVANSFSEWMIAADFDFTIAHPEGYEPSEKFTKGATITHDQDEALKNADFVYVKNWSSFNDYGKMPSVKDSWMLTNEKLKITNSAKVMHCLPVRRNVELPDEVLDGENTLILLQAENRIYAAQTVLKRLLENF